MESFANPARIGGAKRQLKFLILEGDYEAAGYGYSLWRCLFCCMWYRILERASVCNLRSVWHSFGENRAESFWQKGEKMAAHVPSELFVSFLLSECLEGRPHSYVSHRQLGLMAQHVFM